MGFLSFPDLPTMISEQRDNAIVVRAPAKVNLFLEVLAKRPDGYHEITTLMVAVSLYDTLEFQEDPSGEFQLLCDVPDLSTGPDNLIWRAADLLRRHSGGKRGARIRLAKRIPRAAGLAGGSTDAAATLAGLNRLWRLGLADAELARLGAEIGSDVPFFFATPAAWCIGRGEVVSALPLGQPLHLVIACPKGGLSAAEVYRGVKVPDSPETGDRIREALGQGDIDAIGRGLHNRLQSVAERLQPVITEGLGRMQSLQPAGAVMSGSGSSLFALARSAEDALRIARHFQDRDAGVTESDPEVGAHFTIHVVRSCS